MSDKYKHEYAELGLVKALKVTEQTTVAEIREVFELPPGAFSIPPSPSPDEPWLVYKNSKFQWMTEKEFETKYTQMTVIEDDDFASIKMAIDAAKNSKATYWKHVERGSIYEEAARAELQVATNPPQEGDVIVIYQGKDGKFWARAEKEFEDGRFEKVNDKDEA